MEAQYKCRNGRLIIKVEAGDQKSLFERIAEAEAVFDAATKCGLCNCSDIEYQVRVLKDGNKYYELQCRACNGRLSFGQHKSGGTLFPKREWSIYRRDGEE